MKLLFVMKSRNTVERIRIVTYILCKIDYDDILQDTRINKLQQLFKLMLEPMTFVNQQLSISNISVTDDLAFLVILLGKAFSSPKRCMKCKSYIKIWLECGYKICDDWSIKTLKLIYESDSTGYTRLGVKEVPIWEFVEVDKYICPILHNQINLGNNV